MQYTPEQRKLYPEFITKITLKNKPHILIDTKDRQRIMDDLNLNKMLWIENYQCKLHLFDIEDIENIRVKDEHRAEIDKIARKIQDMIPSKDTLSLNQSIQGLITQQKASSSPMMLTE